MGDMADFAISNSMDEFEDYYDHEDDHDYLFNNGYTDAMSMVCKKPIMYTQSICANYYKKEKGIGLCPLCRSKTKLIDGKFGKFYGCTNFPKCKGSRNYD